jgi:hypothetical protein
MTPLFAIIITPITKDKTVIDIDKKTKNIEKGAYK